MNICPKSVFNNRRKFILYTQGADIMPFGCRVAGTQGPAGPPIRKADIRPLGGAAPPS